MTKFELKFTVAATFVIVAPAGIPLIDRADVPTACAADTGIVIAPEDTVTEPERVAPDATSICAGLDGHRLANDGVTATAPGVFATVTFVVAVLVQPPVV